MYEYILIGICLFGLLGISRVEQTERGLVETFGKYSRFTGAGIQWVFPMIQNIRKVNITETMVNAEPQEIITEDKLNATVDAQVYFKVKDDELNVKASKYNVNNYKVQIVALAKTTLRNIIGNMSFKDANSKRNEINRKLMDTLTIETKTWGIAIVRTELKEINPPKEVQETMNSVVMAENKKTAAIDFATAKETEAGGFKRAKIKESEGIKQSRILEAEGQAAAIMKVADAEAKKIEVINQSIIKNFKGDAQVYKKLETTAQALEKGTKYVIDSKSNLVNVISDAAGVTPIPLKK